MRSIQNATFISRNHVLNVDECIFSTVSLEYLQGLLDKIAQNQTFSLRILDLVANVCVVLLKQVHYWQNLAVVGYEGFTDSITASD